MGYYWPTMKRDAAEFVKKCHSCQIQANLIHTHPQNLHGMVTPWPFHTWGLDLVRPVNPPSRGFIWILVATEYFTKWAEAVPLRKVTGGAVANFIKENISIRFGVPHRIISDNGTPFVNNDVRKMLEFYQVKHHRYHLITLKETGKWRLRRDNHTESLRRNERETATTYQLLLKRGYYGLPVSMHSRSAKASLSEPGTVTALKRRLQKSKAVCRRKGLTEVGSMRKERSSGMS